MREIEPHGARHSESAAQLRGIGLGLAACQKGLAIEVERDGISVLVGKKAMTNEIQ